jgi:hypothetical protein
MYCLTCKKETQIVQRDFGRGAYECWGETGVHSRLLLVSKCCDGDYAETLEEEDEPEQSDS